MVERGRELGLAQEPLPEARVGRQLGRDELQGDPPLQPQVLGQVDDAHPAAAKHALDPVAGEFRADSGIEADVHLDTHAVQTCSRTGTNLEALLCHTRFQEVLQCTRYKRAESTRAGGPGRSTSG
jgi:hypothetical protein